MSNDMEKTKKNIIAIGRLLWEKDLASVLNGNISVRLDDEKILLTATKMCLGLLQEKDILLVGLDGQVLEEGNVSTEKLLHMDVYRNFPEAQAIVHTHTTFTNAYFSQNDEFNATGIEAKFWFGNIKAVEQKTPSVTETRGIIEALKNNNVMVIKNHGVVAVGKDLFDCFLLIQSLEDAIKVDAISRLYKKSGSSSRKKKDVSASSKKYKLFSQEQIDEIVRLVNEDEKMQELGSQTNMTMDLAVKCNEMDIVYCFQFKKGKIISVTQDDEAEFVISAPKGIWRSVFNQEIDPFVATTQKKMDLKGDFGKISKWYAPCSRIFELWLQVPVE